MIKKILISIGAFLLFIVIAISGLFFITFYDVKEPEDGAALNENITAILDTYSNIFLIQTSRKSAVLIDTGISEDAGPVMEVLIEKGMNADSVKAIFLTHGHYDHIVGCPVFKNAKIFAMKEDIGIIEGKESMGLMTNDGKVKVTDPLSHGDRVTVDGTLVEVFALPGHSKGSAAYIINDVVFLGDSANATSKNKLKEAVWFLSEDMDLNRESLKKLADYLRPRAGKIEALAFGHTGHLDGMGALLEFADSYQAND